MENLSLKDRLQIAVSTGVCSAVKNVTNSEHPQNTTIKGIKQLADFLGVSTRTAARYKAKGAIKFKQFGRTILFDVSDIVGIVIPTVHIGKGLPRSKKSINKEVTNV